jgi:hypothetical protein
MMDWDDMGQGHGFMGFGALLVGLLLVAVVCLVVFVAMSVLSRPQSGPGASAGPGEPAKPAAGATRSTAESELELRYARGEIDAAQLVQARSVLRER